MADLIEEPIKVQTSAPTENETQVQANQRVADLSTSTIETTEPIVVEPTVVEPTVVEPTITPEVTVEPTKVEETKVIEPTVVEPVVKPTKQPTGKIETAQDIKGQETSNKAETSRFISSYGIKDAEQVAKLVYEKVVASRKGLERRYGATDGM